MFKKVMPYNIKKVYLMMLLAMGLAPTFTSCEKDESVTQIDPNKVKVDQARADSAMYANQVRAAVEPAKTVESDITNYFNSKFSQEAVRNYNGFINNFYDSTKAFKAVVETARIELGDPLPTNETTMTNLYNKSKSYLSTVETLDSLLHRSR
ncbi:MAG: hypothetical protein JW974_00255 [Alphaproteobacteria bacterium]|nr:hypothetical protein [Alphaproteobacteria bacterium]MBN2675052.1 hypothetical protein [Alphaproteobacteria bacterium]